MWGRPGPPNHILSYLICARTHSHTAARVRRLAGSPPLPPTKLLLWSLSQLGPIKDSQDESITSSTRARASSLPLIILSCQVKQPSVVAPLVQAASPVQGQSVASVLGRGCPLLLSDIFDFSSDLKCVNSIFATRSHHITFVWLGCAAQITRH